MEVSPLRLNLLRATYALIFVGLALQMWPGFFAPERHWSLMAGVARSMFVALSLLAALGLRYPLQMLPLLMFELLWKTVWLLAVALPLSQAGPLDEATAETVFACLWGVILPIAIPWRYVWTHYVKKAGDAWGRGLPAQAQPRVAR